MICNIVPLPVAPSRNERDALVVAQCQELLEKLVNHGAVISYTIGLQTLQLCYKTDQACGLTVTIASTDADAHDR